MFMDERHMFQFGRLAPVVFDFDSDVNLWEKADLQTALPLCSTTSAPPADSACLVFFAVCRALRHGAKVAMEAMEGKTMKIRGSDCLLLRSDDGSTWPLPVVIAAILLILLFFLFLFLFLVGLLYCRYRRKSKPLREENATPDENGLSLLSTKAESPV